MPNGPTWPLPSPLSGREPDLKRLISASAEGHCLSLVGMSNVGKSYVLRALCREAGGQERQPGVAFVYVDCNRMVEFTDQGFYELVLRCIKAALAPADAEDPLGSRLAQCYADVVAPSTPFLAHLRFTEAISAVCEEPDRRLVLVLDELDELVRSIDERVLLNLRALRDTCPGGLSYVTASRRRLETLRRSRGSDEFAELFGQSTSFLAPLGPADAAALVGGWVADDGLALEPADVGLIVEESGGHPALLAAVSYALSNLRQEAQAMHRPLSAAQVREQLDSDPACQVECLKLWQDLDQDERRALLQPESDDHAPAWQSLAERHLVLPANPAPQPFCRLFAEYVHRQRLARQPEQHGVRVDVEAGDAWVDGRLVPQLTDLEYRLLLLLYGHLDKIVDKYAVVETVWGQAYIDQVDDARIEKLVSRLRQKLEPDPAEPRYLQTIRGRGYRLVSP